MTVKSTLQALQELHKSLNARLSRRQMKKWATETRRERVKNSVRHEWRKP